ncbi:hypothetical protein A2U01_0082897, partial [Trifolium medium]|nr:hypothetical protein [Trifolium medium]
GLSASNHRPPSTASSKEPTRTSNTRRRRLWRTHTHHHGQKARTIATVATPEERTKGRTNDQER